MVVGSALVHAGMLGLVSVSPNFSHDETPRVISVELVSPAPAAPARPQAAPPQPATPPEAVPAPPPPPPKPKQVVLPEKPTAPKKPDKAKPKPREKEVFKEPPKKQEKDLDDLLAEMRNSDTTKPAASPGPAPPSEAPVDTATATTGGSSAGAELSPEEAAWQERVKRKMKGIWIVPPGFRALELQTRVVVTLDAGGNIVGSPRITQKSGNPWYDEGVIRGLAKASPLPPPPEAGDWVMWFEPGDSL